jgi:hypothetical protein
MSYNRFFTVLLTVVLLIVFSTAVEAGIKNNKRQVKTINPLIKKTAVAYDFSGNNAPSSGRSVSVTSSAAPPGISPGLQVGSTFYEYQHNTAMGRMVETGPYIGLPEDDAIVHFSWMFMASGEDFNVNRSYAYAAYNADGQGLLDPVILHPTEEEYSGYVNVDVTPDNRAIVGGHSDQKGPIAYQVQFHIDASAFAGDFMYYVRLPDSLGWYNIPSGEGETNWPRFFMQIGSGGDTVMHVFAINREDEGGEATWWLTLMYFRYFLLDEGAYWDDSPYIVDTCDPIAQDITGERFGDKVCLTWFSWLAYEDYEGCDTCSGPARPGYDGYVIGSMDNDFYIQVSHDQGETFEPRKNLTHFPVDGLGGFKGGGESSALFDQAGNLHVVYVAALWPPDPDFDLSFPEGAMGWECRLMHWTDTPGYETYFRTICDHTYPILAEWEVSCSPPMWSMHVSKPSISECDGKLYTTFTQFNNIPDSVWDDCASWVSWPDAGGANGDLWVSISKDNGMTWDIARNLTNTYTPACDASINENCANDHWSTMSRWGRPTLTSETWPLDDDVVVDPDPDGYTGSTNDGEYYYLDIQYVEDISAGSMVISYESESGWWDCPIKWMRIPCVEPISSSNPIYSPNRVGDPTWGKKGEERLIEAQVENMGNEDLIYSIEVQEDNGPTGWLSYSGLSGLCPSGLGNVENGYLILNAGGIVDYYTELNGRLIFTDNSPFDPTVMEIQYFVVDTMIPANYDTVYTSCLALVVGNHGGYGRGGSLDEGGVNMDYTLDGECDTTDIGAVYLYAGSAIVGWIDGLDTNMFYSMWGNNWISDDGFRPLGDEIFTKVCNNLDTAMFFQSGTFVTQDSAIGVTKAYVAPEDECPWIISYTKFFSKDGLVHTGLMLGEAIDWDIPWNYRDDDPDEEVSAVNYGFVDAAYQMAYQQGYDSPLDTNCQANEARFGGVAFIEAYNNGTLQEYAMSGSVVDNDLTQTTGFMHQELYDVMNRGGWTGTDSVSDLHSVITYHNNVTLDADVEYEVVTVYSTVHNGTDAQLQANIDAATAWYTLNGGISMFADDDDDGHVDACQSCCFVNADYNNDTELSGMDAVYCVNYLWNDGPEPPCMDATDANGDLEFSGMDVVYLVNYLWNDGPAPADCGFVYVP